MTAIVNDDPWSYERAWRRITRNYRLLTRGLVLASAPARPGAPSCLRARCYPAFSVG
ncbi:oxidoreductase domain protein [Mycobacterium xenopi 4042]|uniref:Oxidoreductase domain protein n=1 Tax=Mycobacterium xenopi 4042 TaxID=1299334 RepID=X8DZQ2_MYCXE|nr:oxidoreductase domain protein [Mycobacterium xenopi 4042]